MSRDLSKIVLSPELEKFLNEHPDVKRMADELYLSFSMFYHEYRNTYYIFAYVANKLVGELRDYRPDEFKDLPELDTSTFPSPTEEVDIENLKNMRPVGIKGFER